MAVPRHRVRSPMSRPTMHWLGSAGPGRWLRLLGIVLLSLWTVQLLFRAVFGVGPSYATVDQVAPDVMRLPRPRPAALHAPPSFLSAAAEKTAVETAVAKGGSAASSRVGGYTFWSSDFHISPIADAKAVFGALGQTIIDKSLSGHCHLPGTCQQDLKVLTEANGIELPCPNVLRQQFFDAYRDDPEMQSVDAFLCHHAASMCELFMPFGRPLVVVASTRYEIGRWSAERWRAWNDNLRAIAANPRNVVAANNLFDAEYIKYYTGLEDVPVIPNYCGYVNVTYNPMRPAVLVGPSRGTGVILDALLAASKQDGRFSMAHIRTLYPHFEYSDLAAHPAIVIIPYQVSIMSLFEYYRMGLPMFVPSLPLLVHWQLEYTVLGELTWDLVFGKTGRAAGAIGQSPLHQPSSRYDPNDQTRADALAYWLQFSDFYQWPHITTFDSFPDLFDKLATTDLRAVSAGMQQYNVEVKRAVTRTWSLLFRRMFAGVPPASDSPRPFPPSWQEGLTSMYGPQQSTDPTLFCKQRP